MWGLGYMVCCGWCSSEGGWDCRMGARLQQLLCLHSRSAWVGSSAPAGLGVPCAWPRVIRLSMRKVPQEDCQCHLVVSFYVLPLLVPLHPA